ncbi:MAG: phosphoglycerate mutase [Planctomycetaceae bacterium]|nr:phosphoglycerate mutase [Planctomycetaceae bacterium]
MVRVVLIRPGTTDYDEQGRIKGTLDIPLNDFGNNQTAQAADELSELDIEIVYSSPCQAAAETTAVLANSLGVKSKSVNRLQNLDHGLWQGKLIDEVKSTQRKVYKQWQEQPDTVCPPEGETLSSARQRVQTALEKILKKHKTGTIGMVIPGPLWSIVRSTLDNSDLGDLWQAETECGSWVMIDVTPDSVLASSS